MSVKPGGLTSEQWLSLAEFWFLSVRWGDMTLLTSQGIVVTIRIHTHQCLVDSKCSITAGCELSLLLPQTNALTIPGAGEDVGPW